MGLGTKQAPIRSRLASRPKGVWGLGFGAASPSPVHPALAAVATVGMYQGLVGWGCGSGTAGLRCTQQFAASRLGSRGLGTGDWDLGSASTSRVHPALAAVATAGRYQGLVGWGCRSGTAGLPCTQQFVAARLGSRGLGSGGLALEGLTVTREMELRRPHGTTAA